jgi:hypothetical protein
MRISDISYEIHRNDNYMEMISVDESAAGISEIR